MWEHLARGWDVTATHRSPSPALEALAREHGGRPRLLSFDATANGAAAALAATLAREERRFDLVFLNPGIMVGRGMALAEIADADIERIFLTNAVAPIRAADALADLVAPGGWWRSCRQSWAAWAVTGTAERSFIGRARRR